MKLKLRSTPGDMVRLSFPDLFVPTQYEGAGPFRYNATLLITPGGKNDKMIRDAIVEVANEAFGKKAEKLLAQWEGNSQKYCYLDGNDKEYEGYEGMMYLAAHRKAESGKPTIIDRQKHELKPEDGKPYAGCYVNASVEIYGQKGQNAGMRCGFSGIQFFEDGDAFSGSAPADPDEFEEYEVPADAAEDLV